MGTGRVGDGPPRFILRGNGRGRRMTTQIALQRWADIVAPRPVGRPVARPMARTATTGARAWQTV